MRLGSIEVCQRAPREEAPARGYCAFRRIKNTPPPTAATRTTPMPANRIMFEPPPLSLLSVLADPEPEEPEAPKTGSPGAVRE